MASDSQQCFVVIIVLGCFSIYLSYEFTSLLPSVKHQILRFYQRSSSDKGFTKFLDSILVGNDGRRTTTYNESQILKYLNASNNCSDLLNFEYAVVHNTSWSNKAFTFTEFKKLLKERYITKYAEPTNKYGFLPPLDHYDNRNLPPDPKSRLHNWTESLDITVSRYTIENKRQQRIAIHDDDDVFEIPSVVAALKQSSVLDVKIPNIVHFIWFSCKRFRLDHFIAVLAVKRNHQPDVILFHTDCEPTNSLYWTTLKCLVDTLHVVKRTPPHKVWNSNITIVEHRSDVARLEILLEIGGIYLDTDSVVLKSLNHFRNSSLVLGEVSNQNLANGMILGSRDSWAIHRWYHEYKYFRRDSWGHNSVMVPWAIWKLWPDKIYAVPMLFCRPNYLELKYIYRYLYNWHSNYIIHMYSRYMLHEDGVEERSLKQIAILNTTYGEIARFVLWGSPEQHDITNWVLDSCNNYISDLCVA